MNLVKAFVVGWLSGWVVGVITAERWRNMGLGYAQGSARVDDPTQPVPVSPSAPPQTARSQASVLIVTGAKTDYALVRNQVQRVLPWLSVRPATAGGVAAATSGRSSDDGGVANAS